MMKRTSFLVLVLEGLVGLHRTASFFSNCHWGIDLDYCDIERFALETRRDNSVIFEIASKYCISDSSVDHEMAPHSSILAWRIPWTEESGGLQSMGLQESDMTEQLNHHHHGTFY